MYRERERERDQRKREREREFMFLYKGCLMGKKGEKERDINRGL